MLCGTINNWILHTQRYAPISLICFKKCGYFIPFELKWWWIPTITNSWGGLSIFYDFSHTCLFCLKFGKCEDQILILAYPAEVLCFISVPDEKFVVLLSLHDHHLLTASATIICWYSCLCVSSYAKAASILLYPPINFPLGSVPTLSLSAHFCTSSLPWSVELVLVLSNFHVCTIFIFQTFKIIMLYMNHTYS